MRRIALSLLVLVGCDDGDSSDLPFDNNDGSTVEPEIPAEVGPQDASFTLERGGQVDAMLIPALSSHPSLREGASGRQLMNKAG